MVGISSVYPKRMMRSFETLLNYSTISMPVDRFVTRMLMMSLLLASAVAMLAYPQLDRSLMMTGIAWIASFAITHIAFYSWLVLSADAKASFVDSILPDALRLIASNLRSGLTVDRALMHSAREEFGPLKDAIDNAGKKIATGSDERTAFRSMVEKIKSDNLSRAVDLIIQGIRSGGELAGILDKIADVFRDRSILSKEMRSSVLMYAIFIFFVLGMGAPVLFGISDFLVRTMTTGIGAEIPDVDPSEFATSQGASVIPTGMRGGSIVPERGASIDPDFMTMYFILGLIISSCTGSIILGQVLSGKEKAGIKFIPLLIGMSILIFFLIKYLLSLTLGSMLT